MTRWWQARILAVLCGATLLAGGMTLRDWWHNPGGVFEGSGGTAWSVVWATWWSWFLPGLGLGTVMLAGLAAWRWIGRRRR